MTLNFSRITLCAALLGAVSGVHTSLAQSSVSTLLPPTSDLAATLPATSLPEAPSTYLAQQQTPTPDTSTSQQTPTETDAQRKAREQREESEREVKQQEKQRIGAIMPNFNSVLSGKAVTLTPGEKINLAFHTIIDPYTISLAAIVGGGYGELTDNHTGYGHGPGGYFARFGAAYADSIDGTMIGNAFLPILLHQDPRYYRLGHGKIIYRILYSASTTFVCKGDNGHRQPNVSNVLGNFIAGGLSNIYYPSDERGVVLTVENASIQTVEGMVGAQLLEFSPDVTDWLHKRKARKQALKLQQIEATTTPAQQP